MAIALTLAAALLSYKLLLKHVTGSSGSSWFEAGCSAEDSDAGADCAAVLASPYSYFPPKHADEPAGTRHLPVAFLGLVYYSTVLLWLIGVGCPSPQRRAVHLVPVTLVALGLAGSVYFTVIMFTRIDEWCPWCLVTHLLNLGLAICLLAMWPKAPATAAVSESPASPSEDSPEAGRSAPPSPPMVTGSQAHPTGRLVLVTFAAIAFSAFGELQLLYKASYKSAYVAQMQGLQQCMTVLNKFRGDAGALYDHWKKTPRQNITIRPDDPVRMAATDGVQPVEAVVFSDFECSSCRKLAKWMHARVEPLFGGHLRLVFKHYPLHRDCNPETRTSLHTHACDAASMAEAVRSLAGSAAFWRVHDAMFDAQSQLKQGKITVEVVAKLAGVDAAKLRDAMGSEVVANRIAEDCRLGRSVGVRGTPSLFVSGRLVETVTRGNIEFWDKLAADFWKRSGRPRPQASKLVPRKIGNNANVRQPGD